MRPRRFQQQNAELVGPVGSGIDPLPVCRTGDEIISCWRLSLGERLVALVFGRVWLRVLATKTQPPIALRACRSLFR